MRRDKVAGKKNFGLRQKSGYRGKKPTRVVLDERMRTVETMLFQSVPIGMIFQFCKEKWGVSGTTVARWRQVIERKWRDDWRNDPDREVMRGAAVRSLQQCRYEMFKIMRTGTLAQKMQACGQIVNVERALASIGGYSVPDAIQINATNVPQLTGPASTQLEGKKDGEPAVLSHDVAALTDYLKSVTVAELRRMERVPLIEAGVSPPPIIETTATVLPDKALEAAMSQIKGAKNGKSNKKIKGGG